MVRGVAARPGSGTRDRTMKPLVMKVLRFVAGVFAVVAHVLILAVCALIAAVVLVSQGQKKTPEP